MKSHHSGRFKLLAATALLLALTACAAGSPQFTHDDPAGFWYGLWHGVIAFISLIIHLFNDNVAVYEIHNTGGWYDFGFLLGVISIWGGGSHVRCKSAENKKREKEWDEIGDQVEKKIMRKLKEWAENEEDSESAKEWEDLCAKVEKKLKRKIRDWAERD